jgi:cytochrome c biogenesis protein CcdA
MQQIDLDERLFSVIMNMVSGVVSVLMSLGCIVGCICLVIMGNAAAIILLISAIMCAWGAYAVLSRFTGELRSYKEVSNYYKRHKCCL